MTDLAADLTAETRHRGATVTCPASCPWQTHPDNPEFQRCGIHSCLIERPKPEGRP